MAAAAAEVAISGPMNRQAILDPAVRPAPRRAARWRPAPATATWTTTFRSERDAARGVRAWAKNSVQAARLMLSQRFNVNSRDTLGWRLKILTETRLPVKRLPALRSGDVNDINIELSTLAFKRSNPGHVS